MILVVDNYDSFTFNLVHLLRAAGAEVSVHRNDARPAEELLRMHPRAVVLSPGPGGPEAAGVCAEIVERLDPDVPLLGVCLGHQVLAAALGGRVVPAPSLVHGKTSWIDHDGRGLLEGLPRPLEAMRYHSLVVDRATLPPELEVSAWLADDPATVMAVRHRSRPWEGIQFHPESFLTPSGADLVAGFLRAARTGTAGRMS